MNAGNLMDVAMACVALPLFALVGAALALVDDVIACRELGSTVSRDGVFIDKVMIGTDGNKVALYHAFVIDVFGMKV